MIRYDLRCENDHHFDGWFRSSEGFETLRKAGQVVCTHCGSTQVDKTLMAPGVAISDKGRDLRTPRDPQEAALEKLRREIESSSDYVGMSFAAEARAMHEGSSPERAIYGEARIEEARKLIEDGIPVAPLPFRTRHNSN